jgi:Secretion system C-terminal sorting domain
VFDTPIHNAPNFGAPSQGHISLCTGYPAEMFNNYMDCTDDSLRTMFTRGQCIRMYATLDKGGPRAKLLETHVQCGDYNMADRSTDPNLNNLGFQVSAFPNPANEVIFVQTNGEDLPRLRVDVFSYSGRRLVFEDDLAPQSSIRCKDWLDGLYYLVFSQDGKIVSAQKISILHQ